MPRPDDEYTDEPPRRRDDEYGDRPPPDRRDEDYVNYPDVRRRTGMDAFFSDKNLALLILLSVCCNGIALILGIVGLAACKDPRARHNALVVTIVSGIITFLGVGMQLALRRF
jgi:hypothetical protein